MPCIFSSRSSGTLRASGGAAETVSARDPSCKWSEEDPQIEVARRKLEQGGTALFVREQQVWAGTRKKREPLLARARRTLNRNWLRFRYRGYLFSHSSYAARGWDWAMGSLVLVLAIAMPLLIAFEEEWDIEDPSFSTTRYWLLIGVDVLYIIDIAVRFRTTIKKDGVVVENSAEIASRYLRTSFLPDLVAVAVPLASQISNSPLILSGFFVLRIGRLKRLIGKLQKLGRGANYVSCPPSNPGHVVS